MGLWQALTMLFGGKKYQSKKLNEGEINIINNALKEVKMKNFAYELHFTFDFDNPEKLGFHKKEDLAKFQIEGAADNFLRNHHNLRWVMENAHFWYTLFSGTKNKRLLDNLLILDNIYHNLKHASKKNILQHNDVYYLHGVCEETREKTQDYFERLLAPLVELAAEHSK